MKPVTDPAILSQLDAQSGPRPVTDPAILAQLEGKPAEPETSNWLGFQQGAMDVLDNAALGTKKVLNMAHIPFVPDSGIGDLLDRGGQAMGFPSVEQAVQNHKQAVQDKAVEGVVPGAWGKLAGDVVGTLPVAPLGPVLGGAAAGALATDPNEGAAGHALGAGLGAGTGLAFKGIGKAIAPQVSAAVQMLARNGVTMTPGQIFGGVTKGVEDRLAGFPIIGDFIKDAQRNSIRDFANGGAEGGVNSALAPLNRVGGPARAPGTDIVPQGHPGVVTPEIGPFPSAVPSGMVGQDSVRFAGDTLSDAYDQVLPHTATTLGPDFWDQALARINQASSTVRPEYAQQMENTVTGVFNKLGPLGDHTQVSGETMKALDSELGGLSRKFAGTGDPNNDIIADVYGGLRDQLRGAVADSNPQLAPQLGAINEGWSKLVPVERAAGNATGNASGLEAGVFSPRQYRQALRQDSDFSTRGRAAARGEIPGQPYAEAGINVLPSSVPDSGTAGRLALPAGIAAVFANPALALKAAAVPAIYNRPVLNTVNAAFAHGSTPTATALGSILQKLGASMGASVSGQRRRQP